MLNYELWRLFGPATWPVWTALLGALAMLAPRLRAALRVPVLAGAAATAVMAFTPLGLWLLRPLENRYPIPALDEAAVRDILVLTGPEDTAASARSGRLEVRDAGERIYEGAALKRRFPEARLWVVGGVRDPRFPRYDWEWTLSLWQRLGVAGGGIGGTRDTCENATGAAKAGINGRPVLITSAWHMPRAVACFHAAGLDPLPYPVDFQFGPDRGFWRDWRLTPVRSIDRADLALHEWVGLAWYRLTGRL